MSDEPPSTPDLATMDLSLSFGPAWARESDSGERLAKMAAKHDREERPERGGPRRDDRGPRSDRRPPRRDGDKRGGARTPRRDDRREERRPEREPEPEPLAGWEVQFLPDKPGVDGLAKQIKSTAKAYPLFDLAHLVLDKSARYHVEFKRITDDAPALFQLKSDGSMWLAERDAVAHAMATQLDKYYRRERVAVEPPKGVYPCVAVCGMSGVLLGPPNYHDYQTKLVRLHAERFANVPFEVFKSRIRMERGEEMIAKWKDEQSTKEVYFPLDPSKPEAPAPEPAQQAPVADHAPPAAQAEEPAAEAAEAAVEDAAPEQSEEPALEAAEPAVESTEAAAPAEGEAPGTPAVESEAAAEEAATPTEAAPRLESLAEVEQHFREHHLPKALIRIRERVTSPGSAALNTSAPAVLRLTRNAWEQLSRFPLPLAHRLAQHLTSRGVHVFKSHDNHTYVGVARPRFLDTTSSPVSASLVAMLKSIEENARAPRAEQWKALLALRSDVAETERETAVAADLLWLLREGHVIDYAKRGLEITRRPKASQPRKPATPVKAPANASAVATPPADEPAPLAEDAAIPQDENPA
ncbi:MAG: hypothetical protein ACREKL_11315 [Chthoniobacterales bacterium]